MQIEQLLSDRYKEQSCHPDCDQNKNNSEDLKARADTDFQVLQSFGFKKVTKNPLICKNLLKYLEKSAQERPSCLKVSAAPASVGSYQHQGRLHRKMLHTVVVWQSILVQVRLAPGSPQALVRATHLTHGRVAHGARFTIYPIRTYRNLSECI